jgi:integrase
MSYKSQQLNRVAENLYRDGNDVYVAKLKRGGKIHKKSLDTNDFALAKRKLRDFEDEVERKKAAGVSKMLFSELKERWLESIRPALKESSFVRRKTALTQLEPYFKGKYLSEIGPVEVEHWSIARQPKVKAQTFNIERETLNLMFRYAKKNDWILGENPVTKIARKRGTKVIIVPPTKAQFNDLLVQMRAEPKMSHALILVQLLAYTGMRLDEARQLKWGDIDFARGTILITGGAKGTKNNQQRVIPLFEPARDLLNKLREGSRPHVRDQVIQIHTAINALISASKKMGMPKGEHFTNHDMRHFFCSNAIELSIPDHVIAGWLGHKDGGILVKTTYGHLRKGFSDDMAKLMNFKA